MAAALLERLGRPVTVVVGKGGVGKTTTAGALARALAEAGVPVHLLSTDPAHSLADLFAQPPADGPVPARAAPGVTLEELDAEALAMRRLDALRPALLELVDGGTYLDQDDARSLLGAALPGLDEVGAALRIAELAAAGTRLVVDTAPTGHTLRLLDMRETVATWVDVFDAMAAKADAVASAMVGRNVRMTAEAELAALAADMDRFHDALIGADFVVVTAPGAPVEAETRRLVRALEERGLHVAAVVDPRSGAAAAPASRPLRRAGAWRAEPALDRELVLFTGKGGVGKSTCAAALAVGRAAEGGAALLGTDPAGSLVDVVAGPVPGLTVLEVDAAAELASLHDHYGAEVDAVFRAIGLETEARLDRQVVESLWGLAPPGVDELVALGRLAEDVAAGVPMIVDMAPTGHALRLLAMPGLALDWLHRIMRILIKYRAVGGLDGPAESLLRLAKQIRALRERIADPARTAIVVVTLDEPIVQAETARLLARLQAMGLPAAVLLVNRADDDDDAAGPAAAGIPALRAPLVTPDGPVGADRLAAFLESWERAA